MMLMINALLMQMQYNKTHALHANKAQKQNKNEYFGLISFYYYCVIIEIETIKKID